MLTGMEAQGLNSLNNPALGPQVGKDPLMGYAYGLERVPYDDYPALLHEDERVLTASQARAMDQRERSRREVRRVFPLQIQHVDFSGPASGGEPGRVEQPISVTVTGNEFVVREDSDIEAIARTMAEQIRLARMISH